jgi:uncharacterized repeat protein (TIGR01451 family)
MFAVQIIWKNKPIQLCIHALFLCMAMVLSIPEAQAATRAFTRTFALSAAGDITIAANMSLHCTTSTVAVPTSAGGTIIPTATQITACTNARSNTGGVINNNVVMVQMDVDSDPTTFNSTSAKLILPVGSTVASAKLYWGALTDSATGRGSVLLATPNSAGAYQTITTTFIDDTAAAGAYQSYADVTSIVSLAGVGTYTVANLATSFGKVSLHAGWSLVVAYENPSEPTRNMVIYDGFFQVSTTNVDILLSGFITPPSPALVTSKIGLVTYDGDKGSLEGTATTGGLQFGSNVASLTPVTNVLNPLQDAHNSTISTNSGTGTAANYNLDRNPNFQNTLGFDADLFSPNTQLPNGATTAVVRVVGSASEFFYPGVITIATTVFVPNIKDSFSKSVVDLNGGATVPGDVLEYTLVFTNTGNDAAVNIVLQDAIPSNTTYVTGSIVLSSSSTGMPTGTRTDASSDDSAQFDAINNRVVLNVGRTATATVGGTLNPLDSQTMKFRVTVNSDTPSETTISNQATITFAAQTLGTLYTELSDGNSSTAGIQPTTIVTASPDLRIAKTHAPTTFAQSSLLPSTPTFSIVVFNTGTIASFGTVTVADILPSGMTALSITGSGWSCTLATVLCTRTDALAVGSSFATITLEVSASVAGSLTNTANVSCACEGASKLSNNTALDPVTVLPTVNLTITKTNGVTSLVAGQTISYTVTVANLAGSSNAAGAVVKDPAVGGLSCTVATCTATGGAVCPAPVLPATLLSELQAGGLTITSFPAASSLSFAIACDVTATGQ